MEKGKKYWTGIQKALAQVLPSFPKTPQEFVQFIDSGYHFMFAAGGKSIPDKSSAQEFYTKWLKIQKHHRKQVKASKI